MTTEAWIFMLSAWSITFVMTSYSFYRMLTSQRRLDGDDEPRMP